MSSRNRIETNLADEPMGGEWEKNTQDAPTALPGDSERWLVSHLKSLIAASGKSVKEAAFDLGMSETHLADHLAFRRKLQGYRVEQFIDRNPGLAVYDASERLKRRRINAVIRVGSDIKKLARKQMRLELERSADMFDLLAERAARAIGAAKQEVVDAWNDVTAVGEDK